MRTAWTLATVVLVLQLAQGTVAGPAVGTPRADPSPIGVAATAHARSSAYIDPGVVRSFETSPIQIVILVVQPPQYGAVADRLAALGLSIHGYDRLHMFAVLLPKELLGAVAAIDGVNVVYENEHMHEELDHSAAYVGATVVWKTYHDVGTGVAIMIVDSGVDGTHPDVRLGQNLVQNVKPAFTGTGLLGARSVENAPLTDFDGHGTHVASIAGGTASSMQSPGKYKGMAYGASLVGYAAGITDPNTGEVTFESQSVLEAFNYAIANAPTYKIRVVSNSWGANGEFDVQSPVNIATLQMYKSGLVVVFAGGNEGEEGPHTMNKYSVAPWVMSVAAGDYLNQVASFSSRGTDPAERNLPFDHPDIVAPGVDITAAKASAPVAGSAPATNPLVSSPTSPGGAAGGYTTKSGTSMAAPHVSGIAALLISAKPDLSPDDVMDILTATATPLTDPQWIAGAGYVNALKAYQLTEKATGHRDSFLTGHVKYAGAESGDPTLARDAVSVGYGVGKPEQLSSGSQGIDQFSSELFQTISGWVFLGGIVILVPLAFRLRAR